MSKLIKLSVASAATLIWVSVATANPDWSFQFDGQSQSQFNIPNTYFGLGLGIFPPAMTNFSGTFTTPDGESNGTFTSYSDGETTVGETQEFFNSFSVFQTASLSSGPWSLSATQNATTSTYQFSPDFSGISPSSIPQVTITSPPANQTTSNAQPTFQWSESGDFTGVFLQLASLDLSVDYIENLPMTQTSWMVPASLPLGSYMFDVQLLSVVQTIPLESTLVSGPDLDLPDSATFSYDSWGIQQFTVVPEPTCMMLAAGLPLLLIRRR